MDKAAFEWVEGLAALTLRELRIRRMNAETDSVRENITDSIVELEKLGQAARLEQKGGTA